MVREEKGKMNYYAGIDLLELFFNDYGFTTPILIFCTDTKKACLNIEERGINKNRVYTVTNSFQEVIDYSKFLPIESKIK